MIIHTILQHYHDGWCSHYAGPHCWLKTAENNEGTGPFFASTISCKKVI